MIKTLIVGPLFTRSGYGEHARFITDSFLSRSDEFDVYVHPIHWGVSSWINDGQEKTKVYEELCIKKGTKRKSNQIILKEYDLLIQVTIPSEWKLIFGHV